MSALPRRTDTTGSSGITQMSLMMSASPDVTTYGRTLRTTPKRPDANGRGASRRRTEVGMLSPTTLGRRVTSAQDRLRAARRDGRFEDIVIWRDELDSLLEQYPRTSEGH